MKNQQEIYSFITGSQNYGIPTKDSDIDLVVPVRFFDYKKLWDLAEKQGKTKLQFGSLNLVAFNIDYPNEMERFFKWQKVNFELFLKKPVTKEEAIKAFREAGAESVYRRDNMNWDKL